MTARCTVLVLALGGAVCGQAPTLASRVSMPLVYMAVTPAASDDREEGDWAADLRRLGLDLPASSGGQTLALLQGLLSGGAAGRSWTELELALTGVLPVPDTADLPLLVCRAQLREASAARLRTLLERGDLASPARQVGAHRVYQLTAGTPQPGRLIELVLLDANLVVSNHGAALDQLLDDRTTSTPPEVLARDPVYRELLEDLGGAPRSVLFHADLARLQHRLTTLVGGDPAWFLRWSGLASAQRMLLAIRPADGGGLRTSVLLRGEGAPDGWLAAVEQAPVQDLLRRLPEGGIGAAAFALQPARLLAADTAGGAQGEGLAALRANLSGGCSELGLDLANDIVARLGRACALQLFGRSADGVSVPGAAAVVSLPGTSREAARSLFTDCKQDLTRSGAAAVQRGARDAEQLVIQAGGESLHVALVGDAVALAFDGAALDQAARAAADVSPHDRRRAERDAMAALERLGAGDRREAAAVFRFDLRQLAPRERGGKPPTTSSYVLCRHTGYLVQEPGRMRVEILSDGDG